MQRINHIAKRRTSVFILLVLSLVLLNNSTALGKETELRARGTSSKSLRSMARVYMAYGEYEKAQPLMEKALALTRKTNASDYEFAMCLIDTACLYKKQNKFANAEKMCEEGLELQRKFLYEKHPYIAYTLRILSSIYREQGKLYQARSALDKATVIMRSCSTEDDYAMVSLEVDTAKLLVAQGDLVQAESSYRHVLSVINKYSPDHFYKARVLEDLAELYLLQGRYAEADPLISQALSMKEKVYGAEHRFLVSSLFIKASIEREKGNHATSEKFIQRALATVKTTKNITRIIEVQQRAEEIRTDKIIAKKLVVKAVDRETITAASY